MPDILSCASDTMEDPSQHPTVSHLATTEKTIQPSIASATSSGQNEPQVDQHAQQSAQNDDEHLSGIKLYTLFLALIFVVLMIALDASIMSTAIPRITDDFHTIANVGWYGSAYMIANACLQPLTGKVYKFFPLKLSFFAFVALFELGSILCAAASSSMMLVIGRAVAGLGGSGLANGSITLIGITAPPSQRPTIMGSIMSMFGIGQLIGPLIGGALTQHASWRWCFWINLPIGAASVAGLLAVRLPPQDVRPNLTRKNFLQNFDIIGFFFFAPASIMLLLALQWGGIEYAWSSATTIGLLSGSAVTYVIFVLWEWRQQDQALFPFSLLRQTIISSSIVNAFLFAGSLLVIAYYLPLWFQVVKHASPTNSAVYTLPTFVSQIFFAIISGPMSNRIGFFAPLSLFGAIVSAIGIGLMTTFTPSTGAGKWIGYQILSGTGRGLAYQQPINTVQAALPKAQLSTGMAMVIWSQFFGGAVFLALGQTAFASLLKSALRTFAPDIDPAVVIDVGATNYETVVPSHDQTEVLLAYNQAITRTYFLPAVVAGLSAFTALGMGWKRVLGKKNEKKRKERDDEKVESANVSGQEVKT